MAKVSTKGYKKNSKDKNEPYLQIPSGMITMKEDDGTPLRKGPILGIDNFGNQQLMMPGADYQFPGTSVYEIPMAKMGGAKKVRIHSLPKAENGGEKDKPKEKPKDKPKEEVIYTAGTNEPWTPLPEMTPAESDQWMGLRDAAIPITGKHATNQQIYATYKRAKEMGLGYDEYMGKQMANLQKKRESVVPKPIPGWNMTTDELKQLSELPESPVFYNGDTGEYFFAHTEAYDPSQDWVGSRGPYPGVTRGDIGLAINPKMFNERAESLSKQNADRIELFNSGQINQYDWEKIYGSPYDPNLDYTVTPEELKASYWKGPTEDLKRKGTRDEDFPGYEYNKYNAKDIYTYTHHLTPDERIMRDAYQGAKADMNTPLAKFLGSKGEPPRSVLERNYRISADNLANEAIGTLQGIIGNKANSERFRSMLDMDPKIFQDIINSPFRSGVITLDTNKHGWGEKQTINDKEAKDILRSIEFIKRSGKYNFLLDPSPADMAIQGIGNTLSWMAGNDNAEGPGTIGEAFHDFTGYNAHNKGYSLANTFESPLVAGRNIVENIMTPLLSDYKGASGIRTIDDPGYDFFTEVPTMRGMNMTWNPNYSQLENDIANFTYTAAQDATLTGLGMAARPFVNKAFNTFGSTFGNNFFTDSKSYRPNRSTANDIRFKNFDTELGMDMSNYEVAGELAKTKSQYVSPFDLSKYNFAPGSKTGRLKGKPLFGDVGTSNIFSTNNKVLSAEGAKHFNNKYGLNYKQFDEISPADLQNHIGDVFDYHAPKPSKTPGGVKFKPNFLNDAGDADSGFKISNKWTKDQLADARNTALDFDSSGLNLAGPLRKNLGSQIAAGGLYSVAGAGGLLIGNELMESEGKPLYNKAVPYLNAGARQLGINSNPFSLATPSGSSSTQGTRQQVMMSLNDEGNNVSSARVNETAEGDVIIGGEFIEGANNTVNKASWFNENPDASISDKNFTVRDAKGFYGVEKGKFKAGKLEDFDPETVVVPIRPFANSYEPVKQAGVTKDNTLRLITDPKDPDNPDSGIIYNNAAQSGKMMFYSPSNKNAWFIYNADPATTSEQINKLIQENPDIRYVPIDNGRYEHYVDKQDGPLNENDFKEYYAADVGRQGNPGYNIVLKRKPKQEQGKKLGGAIYRTGGEVPKPKFQKGGDISVPNLRRVKIHSLPKAQDGTSVTDNKEYYPPDDQRHTSTFYITPDKKTNELIGQIQFNPDTAEAFKTLVDSPDKKLRVVNYPYGYSYMAPGHIEAAAWDTVNNQPINSIGNSQTRVNRWDSGNLRVDADYEDSSKVRTADLNLNPARLAQFLKYSNTPQDYNFLMDNCADGVCRALGMDPRLYTTVGITDPARVMDHVINSGEFNPTNIQGRRVDIPEGLGTIFDNQVYDPYVKPYVDKAWNQGKQMLDDSWNYLFKKEGGELDKYQRKGQVKLNIPGDPLKIPANLQQKKLPTPSINFKPQLGINIPNEYKNTFDLRPRPKAAPTAPANENVFSDFDFKKMNQDLISGSAVAESTMPANTFKPPLEWEGLSGPQILDLLEAQKLEAERQRELDSRDVLTADTKSDSEKLARKAWTAISHPMETLAAVSRGYSIPYGYMGMHNPYDGLGIGSPMTSVVDLAAGIPGFLANAVYRQGEKIVDNPGEYLLTNTLGLFDPKYSDEALGNYLDLSAAVPAVRGLPRLPNQISNYTTKVGRQLSEIERRGAALGLNDFEIAQKQLSDVGITANQRRGYIPGASELFNKYVTPFGYGSSYDSKLAETFKNIQKGGWEAPRRAAMGNITAETSAAEANTIRNMNRDLNIRDDAWRTYLGMPQKNFTFNMANTAPAMHPAYKPGSLAGMDIYNIPENRVFGTGFDEVTNTIGPHYSLRDRGMDPLNKPILLDRDHILMGGYNKVLTKDGLQYNDIWDLDPTINFSSLVPKSVKKFMPEKLKEKLFYKDVPISRAQTHPGHTSSGYNNQPLIVTQPRQMKIPVSKFIGKPFMSHGNLNYTSTMYVDDLSKALESELGQLAPEGLSGLPVNSPQYNQALDLQYKLELLKSGAYPKYKSGGGVKRVKINALPNNWKTT
jgi:hypothetical protein